MERERLKGNLELRLLSVLAAGPGHGYAIITALRERSEGAWDRGESTVYPARHRLEAGALPASARRDAPRRARLSGGCSWRLGCWQERCGCRCSLSAWS